METTTKESSALLERISVFAILSLFFLIPVLVTPLATVPAQVAKLALFAAVTLGTVLIVVGMSLRKGEFSLPHSLALGGLYLLPLGYALSAAFSETPFLSFFGYQLESDTVAFMVLGALATHATLLVFKQVSAVTTAFSWLLASFWVVCVVQILQFATGGAFPLASFADPAANLIGRWNDLGIFAGLIGSLSLLGLSVVSLSTKLRGALIATLVASVIVLALVNIGIATILFGITACAVLVIALVERFSAPADVGTASTVTIPTFALVCALVVLFFGGLIATPLQTMLGVSVLEVRPSLEATTDVLRAVYAESPIMGTGPNTFDSAWLLYRSPDIVQTPFWNISFSVGSSNVLSALATGGVVVFLAWLGFLASLVYVLFRAFFSVRMPRGEASAALSLASLAVMYLLAVQVFYTPSQSIVILFFLSLGLLLVSLRGTSLVSEYTLRLRENPRLSVGVVLVSVLFSVLSLVALYGVGAKVVSIIHHNQAIVYANEGNFSSAFSELDRAVRLDKQDRYYRTAALIQLAQLNTIISGTDSSEQAQRVFQNTLAGAIENTGAALLRNPNSFENLMTRALVYAQVVPLNITGAFENAVRVYGEARAVNPHDPEIDLRLARLYALNEDTASAEQSIAAALTKKADYTQAILLRAQLALEENNLDAAITSVKNAVFFEPQNSVLLYQLGILLLQDENYEEAATAFELALQVTPEYANAAFFLAQAYASLDRIPEAAQLMQQLAARNPDNDTAREYAEALARGENPFVEVPVAPEEEDDEEVIE